MKNKMVWKLTACFAAVLLFFTTVMGGVFVYMFRHHTIAINRAAMEEKAVSIAETLADFQTGAGTGMGMGYGRGGMGGYGAYLRFLNQIAMAEVWVVDEQLNLLTPGHGQSPSYGELPENAEEIVKRVFNGEITYGEEFSGLLDTPTITVGAPIQGPDGVLGVVLLHSPASGVDEAVYHGMSAFGVGVLAALLLAGAAAFWLSCRVTAPLRGIQTAALRLAEGDYSARTGVVQGDEIGQLAKAVDFLSGRLAQADQERAALDQLKQDFVANVSHELRTPVAVLRGSLEVLVDGTVSDSQEVEEYHQQMLAESRHLERLVNDLLDLSRLQDAQFQLDMGEVNLCDLTRDTARSIRRAIQSKGLELSTQFPEEECLVRGDYGRLRQLVLIFLDNAVKFSKEGGRVTLALEEKEKGYLLSVTNQGEDIPAEELPRLFDRFYKTHSGANRSGTGLGLAIAKQIADRHQIEIQVQSGGGKTSFTLVFP